MSATNITSQPLPTLTGPLELPSLIFGCGTFSNAYNPDAYLSSDSPLQSVKLALKHGMNAFDTSVYYGDSEIVLGDALKSLEGVYPRSSYKLMTKCGRFSLTSFDYTPSRIRQSVLSSLTRLQTTYLDVVYLHDVEFIATPPSANEAHTIVNEAEEPSVRGEGDQKVLDAIKELRDMQTEGLIRYIGISGYPLPTLLRLALLSLHIHNKPLDILLSYSNLTLQNSLFASYIPLLIQRAKIGTLLTASPFSMGLLTDKGPPAWHPAPERLRACVEEGKDAILGGTGMPDLATGYAIRKSRELGIPLVVGLSTPSEVSECMRVWRDVTRGDNKEEDQERIRTEDAAKAIFAREGYLDWCWPSPFAEYEHPYPGPYTNA